MNPECIRSFGVGTFVERRRDRGEAARIALVQEMQCAVPADARAQRRALRDLEGTFVQIVRAEQRPGLRFELRAQAHDDRIVSPNRLRKGADGGLD